MHRSSIGFEKIYRVPWDSTGSLKERQRSSEVLQCSVRVLQGFFFVSQVSEGSVLQDTVRFLNAHKHVEGFSKII